MRFFYILAFSSVLSVPAFAADLGTYRPGAPYHSVPAPGADVCENQCAGDAQCRGWNYVKVNPRSPGVCEFNSKPASPIESPISISGDGAAVLAPNISIGRTNTVRVGTAAKAAPRPTVRQLSPTQRIVRQAVPQPIRPEQAIARSTGQVGSLTSQQNNYRQATGHIPGYRRVNPLPPAFAGQPQYNAYNYPGVPAQARQANVHPQAIGGQVIQGEAIQGQRLLRDPRIVNQRQAPFPQFQHNLEGRAAAVNPQQFNQASAPNNQRINNQGRPPIGVPIPANRAATPTQVAPQKALPRGSVNDPVTYQNAPSRIREAELAAIQRAAQAAQPAAQYTPPVSYEDAQQNLFGSLNDDVAAPRPLLSAPTDSNAPIATSQSRPTIPVFQEPLGVLAGG